MPKAPTEPSLGETLEFMRLLWSLDHGLQVTSKQMEVNLGVTGLQRLVIRLGGRFPGISAGDLARILFVHPSTLTGVFRRLEERGLVVRTADPLDARRARFQLTPKGRLLDVPQPGTVEAAVQRAVRKLPTSKLKAAKEVLGALATELGATPETLGPVPTALPRAKAQKPAPRRR
jgi:MarR family transcriptional regulator, organic hydroperoxide resistance regulator